MAAVCVENSVHLAVTGSHKYLQIEEVITKSSLFSNEDTNCPID